MALWLAPQPLVLASKSAARRLLLESAGIPVEIMPADIDERAVEKNATGGASGVATHLAAEKAKAISMRRSGRYVLGADQTLALGERRFSKPLDRAGARQQLSELRGQTHELHSGFAVAHDGIVLASQVRVARLTMRAFSDSFLDAYLDGVGTATTTSVGGYQVEGRGIQLFDKIEGDHSTILGMPLLPLLEWLRRKRLLVE